jgi:uncharacterized Tic20 family protein
MGGMSESTPPTNPYLTVAPMSASDEKMWATLIHIGGIFFGFLPALIGYIVLKDRGPFIRAHALTALNFQLTMLIVFFIGAVTSIILIGLLVILVASILLLVYSILAAVAANNGQYYTYPYSFPLVS